MYKVLLFAGTAEGRKIAEYLKELGETEEPLADADMEQTLEDIEDMIRQM